jgi:hypothetical protein
VLLAAGVLALIAPAAATAATANDDYRSRIEFPLDGRAEGTNDGAGVQAGEPLTSGTDRCDGVLMDRTVWFRFVGDGQPVTVSSAGSHPIPPTGNAPFDQIDTVLAVYKDPGADPLSGIPRMPSAADRVACNDDAVANTVLTSAKTFQSAAGQAYLVQVGACSGCTFSGTPTTREGRIQVEAFSRPPNDEPAAATPLPLGVALNADNRFATADPVPDCFGAYGSTVWFAFDAPRAGDATFNVVSDFGAVVAVHREGSPRPCARSAGGSANLPVRVSGGRYLVEVGGADGATGTFVITASFTPDYDLDGDKENGRPVGNDCRDDDPAINSAAVDVFDNGVDENCDGVDAQNPDRDGDGTLNTDDCSPLDPRIHPGAKDAPENGVNEDCKGGDAQFQLLPTSPRAFFGRAPGGYTVVKLSLRDVPKGLRIEIRCRATRGCAAKRRTVTRATRKRRASYALPRFTSGALPRGSVLEIRVSKPGFVGRRFRWGPRMTGRDVPLFTELCVKPGRRKPYRCR